MESLSVEIVSLYVRSNLGLGEERGRGRLGRRRGRRELEMINGAGSHNPTDLPLVAVVEELLLVVEQLLVRLRGELEVGPLHDRVHRTRLLGTLV